MKGALVSLLVLALALLCIMPIALPIVSAQSGYSIDQVDHTVEILYSGNMVILDTFHVSGYVPDGFTIALPYLYSAEVLKVLAYDSSHIYSVNVGVPLPDHVGFYGVSVDFNGVSPSQFTVAFVLSNDLTHDQGKGKFLVEFPAYPSLTQTVGTVNVNVVCPSTPLSISIGKADGNISASTSYSAHNLAAYTYSIAQANIKVPVGAIQASTIMSLNRDISIDVTGTVKAVDTYRMMSNASSFLTSYVLSLPSDAENIDVKGSSGETLNITTAEGDGMLLANVTFGSFVTTRQATTLTVNYDLPGAKLVGSQYMLSDFQLFAKYQYVVRSATMTFTLPEGASITSPTVSALDASSTLARNAYQDRLTVTANDVSYVDYLAPQENTIQLSYTYNPVWVSFSVTLWASLAAAVFCVGAVVYRWKWPKQTYVPIIQNRPGLAVEKPVYETVKGAHITADNIIALTGAYEDRKHLTAELHALDSKALRGKIARRQYKGQRSVIESRIEGLTETIERNKAMFRGAAGGYPDLIKQLDLAEADLADAEERLSNLEVLQSRGEISLETYKRGIAEAQKTRNRAELVINGTLSRLREKIR